MHTQFFIAQMFIILSTILSFQGSQDTPPQVPLSPGTQRWLTDIVPRGSALTFLAMGFIAWVKFGVLTALVLLVGPFLLVDLAYIVLLPRIRCSPRTQWLSLTAIRGCAWPLGLLYLLLLG